MGWLYSQRWPERKDLIAHLVSQTPTLKHCCVGNNLWCVHEVKGITFVCLYLMRRHGGDYPYRGYKDIDETAGPYQVNCPLSYLEGLSEPVGFAIDWRKSVHEYHARRNRKLKINDKIQGPGGDVWQVCGLLGNAGYKVTRLPHQGVVYRLSKSQATKMEIFE